jgi:acyl-CoA synthetase (AMP-forming)/AMP-acid ligase II
MVAHGKTMFARLLGRTIEGMLAASEPEPFEPVACRLDDTALITFTTGSTGTPKGSNRTQFFLNAQGVALAEHLPRLPRDVDMPALPVFVLNNLGSGIPSVLPLVDFKQIADVDPRLILDEIHTWKVTTIGGSPAYLEPIARHCLQETITLDTIRGVVTGGAPVTPELLRMLQQVCPNARGNIEILYGSTEAEPVAKIEADVVVGETAARTEAGEGNCVGLPVPDIQLKIVAANPEPWQLDERGWAGVELPQGQVGELMVTGDHVQKDYYRNPDAVTANKVTAPDGEVWHRMGDLGYLDEQGRIWLVGRVNNAVRAGERWLYPIQVESRVENLEGVRRAALLSLEAGVLLVVVPSEGAGDDGLREQVLATCRAADWPIEQVRFRASIPLDPRHNAKIDHRALAAELAQEGA